MKLSEAVMPISEVKANASKLIHDVSIHRKPVVITLNGRAKAIVQDLQTYEQTQDSLALLKILAQSRDAARKGRIKPLRQAFAEVRQQIQVRRPA